MTSVAVVENASAAEESRWDVEIVRDAAAIADLWRAFERSAHGTPYQRADWCIAHAETIGRATGLGMAIGLVRSPAGRLCAILPCQTRRVGGVVATLEVIGGKHANYGMPLFDPGGLTIETPARARVLLASLAAAAEVDVVWLRNQPVTWQGLANPLALAATSRSPSFGHRAVLPGNLDRFLASIMSSDTRKKLRKKRRHLEELGPVTFRECRTEAEAAEVLAAFHAQKAARLADRGMANPFATPGTPAFLARATIPTTEGPAAVRLFALRVGERIVATFGATASRARLAGMFNSFDLDPVIARSSPGELLLVEVIGLACREGLAEFDLGVGEAPYKETYCREVEPLVDTVIGFGPLGWAAAGLIRGAVTAKRHAKERGWHDAVRRRLWAPRRRG